MSKRQVQEPRGREWLVIHGSPPSASKLHWDAAGETFSWLPADGGERDG